LCCISLVPPRPHLFPLDTQLTPHDACVASRGKKGKKQAKVTRSAQDEAVVNLSSSGDERVPIPSVGRGTVRQPATLGFQLLSDILPSNSPLSLAKNSPVWQELILREYCKNSLRINGLRDK